MKICLTCLVLLHIGARVWLEIMLAIDILVENLGQDQMVEIRCPVTGEVIQMAQYFNNNKSRFLTEFEEIKVFG